MTKALRGSGPYNHPDAKVKGHGGWGMGQSCFIKGRTLESNGRSPSMAKQARVRLIDFSVPFRFSWFW